MSRRAFVDTNIWVYAIDTADRAKQARALEVLDPDGGTDYVISAQVLGEFYTTVTGKLRAAVTPAEGRAMVERMKQLPVVPIDVSLVEAAIAGSHSWQLSYWDALILVAARSAGCTRLLTEDLADGSMHDGVRVVNPFAEPLRLAEAPLPYGDQVGPWDDHELMAQLGRYEDSCRAAGMRPNAIHSYWDYARRFLAWRVGEYRPRGVIGTGRPVPGGTVTGAELEEQASGYASAIEAAGREQPTVDTYHRHAMFFIRWLRGEFEPGGRLR